MKKILVLGGVFLLGIFLFVNTYVWAKNKEKLLVFNLVKQEENFRFVKEEEGYAFSKAEERQDQELVENFDILWQAEFDYPWQDEAKTTRSLSEENLVWDWFTSKDRLIGESEIASCPIVLEYFWQDDQLKAKASFTNTTDQSIENLSYQFILEYPQDFDFDPQEMILSKNNQEIKMAGDPEAEGYSLIQLYEGVYESALEFSLYVGDILPGKSSEVIVSLLTP